MTTVNKFALRCFGGNLRVNPDIPQKGTQQTRPLHPLMKLKKLIFSAKLDAKDAKHRIFSNSKSDYGSSVTLLNTSPHL